MTAVAESVSVNGMVSTLYAGGTLTILPVLTNPSALGQTFEHGLGGAGTEFAVTRLERELEMGRGRKLAFQHGRQTICGHDVKADGGNGDDAGVPDFLLAGVDVLEHRDFSGDVEVMRSGAQARGEHRPAGGGERTRAVQHGRDAFKVLGRNRRVGEIEYARFKAQFVRQRPDVFAVAAGQNRAEIVIFRIARGEPAGVAVGAVDHPHKNGSWHEAGSHLDCPASLLLRYHVQRLGPRRSECRPCGIS